MEQQLQQQVHVHNLQIQNLTKFNQNLGGNVVYSDTFYVKCGDRISSILELLFGYETQCDFILDQIKNRVDRKSSAIQQLSQYSSFSSIVQNLKRTFQQFDLEIKQMTEMHELIKGQLHEIFPLAMQAIIILHDQRQRIRANQSLGSTQTSLTIDLNLGLNQIARAA
jgi:hypothetical protein